MALTLRCFGLRVGILPSSSLRAAVVGLLIQIRASATLDHHSSHAIRSFTATYTRSTFVGENVMTRAACVDLG